MEKGLFIAIEGTDGSGKTIQSNNVSQALKDRGHEVDVVEFPRYGEESAVIAESYLNGRLGTAEDNGPYLGSLYFAIDRAHAAGQINSSIEQGNIVIANRFIGSNMAHQGQKIDSLDDRLAYYDWIQDLEHNKLGVPVTDKNLILVVDPAVAQSRVDEKGARDYTELTRDIHEADLNHLRKAAKIYKELANIFPDRFIVVDCMDENGQLSIDEVFSKLFAEVTKLVEE